MADTYPPTVQRPELLKLVEALGCRATHLRRDGCGDWQIAGSAGHIYAVPGSLDRRTPGFQIYIRCDTVRQWSAVKAAMSFDITQDGGSEGFFFVDRLPSTYDAGIIRRCVGLKKKREDSEETLAALNQRTSKYRFQPKGPASGKI